MMQRAAQAASMADYDVVVVGGGPGGVGAAVRAAQSGARTLLIERGGFLGGAATMMMVNPIMPVTTCMHTDEQPQVLLNAGLVAELAERLQARAAGGVVPSGCIAFDDEVLRLVLDEMVQEAGVTVLYHATLYDPKVRAGRVQAVQLAHNNGPLTVPGRVFVDATGDALLAARAGAQIEYGDADGTVMPMTLFFAVGAVDPARMPDCGAMKALCAAGATDTPALINTNYSTHTLAPNGLVYFNVIRIGGNTLDPLVLSAAEAEGRRRIENFVAWLRARVPGYERCVLVKSAVHIGIRESRRVMGDYVLRAADFEQAAQFTDAIACCAYPVDIHHAAQGQTTMRHLPPGAYYQIPYRCLTPLGLQNVLMAARSISCDRTIHSSLRVMATVMNIGEAAGYAAALSLPKGRVRAVCAAAVQECILAHGGLLAPAPFHPAAHMA